MMNSNIVIHMLFQVAPNFLPTLALDTLSDKAVDIPTHAQHDSLSLRDIILNLQSSEKDRSTQFFATKTMVTQRGPWNAPNFVFQR